MCLEAMHRWGLVRTTHPLLVESDLLCEALLGEVADRIVVRVCQEVRQAVLAPRILLRTLSIMTSTFNMEYFCYVKLQCQALLRCPVTHVRH